MSDPLLKRANSLILKRLLKGVRSSMHTTIPSPDGPCMAVCYTGSESRKTRYIPFLADSRHKDYDEGRTLTVNDLKIKTVWDYLTEIRKLL